MQKEKVLCNCILLCSGLAYLEVFNPPPPKCFSLLLIATHSNYLCGNRNVGQLTSQLKQPAFRTVQDAIGLFEPTAGVACELVHQ